VSSFFWFDKGSRSDISLAKRKRLC
jgi:hypothetical protein